MKSLILLVLMMPLPALAIDWGQIEIQNAGRDEEGYNWVSLNITLNEGWKTYWEHAGQNGLDPIIEISQNGEPIETQIHWPEPHLFIADDLPSLGYKDEVVVPLSFIADGKVDIVADLGVCETVCIPLSFEFNPNIQAGYSIQQFILQGAPTAPEAEICDWSQDQLALLDPAEYWLFLDEDGLIQHSAPEDFTKGKIYALNAEGITPQPCA